MRIRLLNLLVKKYYFYDHFLDFIFYYQCYYDFLSYSYCDLINYFDFDLCDWESLNKNLSLIKNIAGVIHFAAFKSVPESVADPLLYYHNNIESLVNILRFCKEKSTHANP